MDTRKLYDEDAYRTQFEAVVVQCSWGKKGYEILLDQTCFFPEEGGQSADTGELQADETWSEEMVQVADVQIRDGQILHICNKALSVGTKVRGRINWEKRFSDMQQHSGEHIVSGLVYSTFGYHNVGFHLSSREVTMDFDGEMTWDQVKELEKRANGAVYENFEVQAYYPSPEELKTLNYRSKKELDGPVRIVTFPGYDVCACCAPHVHRTGEIGLIKIVHLMKYKGGVRVNLLCGARALADYQENLDSVLNISTLLSAKTQEVYAAVQKLQQDCGALRGELAGMELEHVRALAAEIPAGEESICLFERALGNAPQRELVNLLTAKKTGCCGVFVGSDQEGYRYIMGCSSGDARTCQEQLKAVCTLRGGGSAAMTQGSLQGTRAQIEAVFAAL